MTFLPIVERELRVAARKGSTIWLRVLAGLIALVIAAGFLTLSMTFGAGNSRIGPGLFSTLTWLALAVALATGLFFTADSLSEEKREGTLGFLFLTDLRGFDVVGGKLMATSLRGSYSLLALFPVLAITLIMGGVTGLQFWKSALALVNALVYSLAAGLFVSSFCRDSQRAMAGTFLLLLLACAAGPVFDALLAAARRTAFMPIGSLVSPVYVFWAASAWGKAHFWSALLGSHLLGWSWFTMASLLAPRTWQQRGARLTDGTAIWRYSWRYGRAAVRTARRRRLMDPNPVMWLAARERGQSLTIWFLVLLLLVFFAVLILTLPAMIWVLWAQTSWLILVVLYLWAASQACRFNVEARRSGLLELLLVTPLDGREIITGQWRALLRRFGWPVLLLVLVELAGSLFAQRASLGAAAVTAGVLATPLLLSFIGAAASVLSMLANLAALIWFGMWMGLISKNASMATLKTIVFVQVLPWLAISFASTLLGGILMFSGMLRGGAPSNTIMLSFPLVIGVLSAVLSVGKDAAFFFWARERLNSNFRAEAARLPGIPGTRIATPSAVGTPLPPVVPAQR